MPATDACSVVRIPYPAKALALHTFVPAEYGIRNTHYAMPDTRDPGRERSDMKKLEKEQLPKVIALGAMATGLLGYAGYSWLGHGGAGAPAAAAPAHPAVPKLPVTAALAPNDPLLALAPIEHDNPFVPAFQASAAAA